MSEQLRDFKGAHYGEAMVVCGLGASIKSFAYPNRFRTIGVNDIGRAFHPDYLFVMDAVKSFAPERFQFIQNTKASCIFTDHNLDLEGHKVIRFPIKECASPQLDDPDALYHIGRPPTSPFLAVCLAAHMGAKAIGIIGVDFTSGHFFADDGDHKLSRGLKGINWRFHQLGNALLERGVKVFNLSAESRIIAFPHLSADQFSALQRSTVTRSWSRPARKLCLVSTSPPSNNLRTLAQLVNTRTSLSCRLISPDSADVRAASSPEIEKNLRSSATVIVNCDTVRLPDVTTWNGNFSQAWNKELRPLLFSHSTVVPRSRTDRTLSVGVIVSQENATGDEVAETLRSLWDDLLPADDLVVLGCRPHSNNLAQWLSHLKLVRYVEPARSESYIAARNRIAAHSRKDILVFTDANIAASRLWVDRVLSVFNDESVAAVGPAIVDMYQRESKSYGMKWCNAELSTSWLPLRTNKPYAVPLLPGVFLAVRRSAFNCVGGLDAGMLGDKCDDMELCFRLWTRGFRCVVAPDVEVLWMNRFAAGASPGDEYWSDVMYNLLRLSTIHFNAARRSEFAESLARDSLFPTISARVMESDARARRKHAHGQRQYSDNWFFRRFPI